MLYLFCAGEYPDTVLKQDNPTIIPLVEIPGQIIDEKHLDALGLLFRSNTAIDFENYGAFHPIQVIRIRLVGGESGEKKLNQTHETS